MRLARNLAFIVMVCSIGLNVQNVEARGCSDNISFGYFDWDDCSQDCVEQHGECERFCEVVYSSTVGEFYCNGWQPSQGACYCQNILE